MQFKPLVEFLCEMGYGLLVHSRKMVEKEALHLASDEARGGLVVESLPTNPESLGLIVSTASPQKTEKLPAMFWLEGKGF